MLHSALGEMNLGMCPNGLKYIYDLFVLCMQLGKQIEAKKKETQYFSDLGNQNLHFNKISVCVATPVDLSNHFLPAILASPTSLQHNNLPTSVHIMIIITLGLQSLLLYF